MQGIITMNVILMAIIFGMSAAALIGSYRRYQFTWNGNLQGNSNFNVW